MSKFIYLTIVFFILLANAPSANEHPIEPKAAFVKNNHLWIKNGENEKQITSKGSISYPKWSFDGNWIAYLKGNTHPLFEGELWLYSLKEDKHIKLHDKSIHNFQWSPTDNSLGFQVNPKEQGNGFRSRGHLYMADVMTLTTIQHMASTISNFSWLPDGSGFLISTKTGDKLDSTIELSEMLLESKKAQHVFTIPVAENEYFIATSPFKWSKDNQWIAFLLIPTASMSADSNTLCILSSDGKLFSKADKMLNYDEWFQWAPSYSLLGTISGEGREATNNKALKLHHPLYIKTEELTPTNSVDRDLTWLNDKQLVTARSIKSEWVDEEKRPLPSLVMIDIHTQKQTQFSNPAKNEGDFRPQQVDGKLVWIRTNRETASVWMSDTDGSNQKEWITMIDIGNYYYEKWDWDEVFGLYIPKN